MLGMREIQGFEPFGALLPGRNYSSDAYRFGFNGKENDNEVHGSVGTFQDYGMRAYDTRVGRFFSVDPIGKDYPWYSPYQFAGNKVISCVDLDGLEEFAKIQYTYRGTVFFSRTQYLPANRRALDANGNLINTGTVVLTQNFTNLSQIMNMPAPANPRNWRAGFDFQSSDIVPDDGNDDSNELFLRRNRTSSSALVDSWPVRPVQVNFGENDASVGTVQAAYNNDQGLADNVDLLTAVMVRFQNLTLTVTGHTDRLRTDYVSNNPGNPDFGLRTPDGNVPLSYDRADALGQFLTGRARSLTGDSGVDLTSRISLIGAGSSRASQPAGASESARLVDRRFTFRINANR
jgi:RHS repeat-associated protein